MPINKLKGIVENIKLDEKLEGIKEGISKIELPDLKKISISDRVSEFVSDESHYRKFVSFMEENFHKHLESEEIHKVMDEFAHAKGYGGAAWHRIADGRHSIKGAFDAISDAHPNMEVFEKAKGAFQHLWADFHSVNGVALYAFDNYEDFKQFCAELKLDPEFVKDLLTVNSTELISSALSILPVIFRMDEMTAQDFARTAGRLGILTSFGSSQFEMASGLFALTMLGKSYFEAGNEGVEKIEILKEAMFEGSFTGLSMTAVALTPFPVSLVAPFLIVAMKTKVDEVGVEEFFNSNITNIESFKDYISEVDFKSMLNTYKS